MLLSVISSLTKMISSISEPYRCQIRKFTASQYNPHKQNPNHISLKERLSIILSVKLLVNMLEFACTEMRAHTFGAISTC